MQYEMINPCSEKDPKNANLGLGCTPSEQVACTKLFKQYKDIFLWIYDDPKTYVTNIIYHVIPLEPNVNPY